MISLAEQADVDTAAVISYTIDGLPGSMELKGFMYEASTISELKKKLKNYDTLIAKHQDNKGIKQKDVGTKPKNGEVKKGCFTCGDITHRKVDCPKKNDNIKCFKCGESGHLFRQCVKDSKETERINCIRKTDSRPRKWVKVNGQQFP